ncbi:hypothetical protein [Paraburkholderia lycopersici]|nr:hypothetical protein [Paraburkholderia lycopersici]
MLMFGATVVSLLFMHFSFRSEAFARGSAKLARKAHEIGALVGKTSQP